MKNLQVVLFAFAVIAFFVWFANSIPQIESRPAGEVALGANLTPQQHAAAGKQIVEAKGGCLACHSVGTAGARAPDLNGVGARSATRKAGLNSEQYLHEALTDPCAYVVEGYQCIMQPVNKPPVALSEPEVAAVIAYLQSLGGEITVKPVEAVASSSSGASAAESVSQMTAATTPQEIMQVMACGACHAIADVEGMVGKVGPELTHVGTEAAERKPDLSIREYIRESILDPGALITPECPTGPCATPSVMPAIFGEKLTAKQLETLVDYLAQLK